MGSVVQHPGARRRLVVVGNGMAGARAVEEVLARGGDEQFDITVFGAEPYGNYNRILLSNVLSGAQEMAGIFINPLSWYEENGITLYAGSPVVEIDRASRMVQAQDGTRAGYDALLLATGSRSFIPPMGGLHGPDGSLRAGVHSFRTMDDCSRIIADASPGRVAAVIGGGLLGLEAARGLLNHGCLVHVVHLGAFLMEAQLDSSGAALLRAQMERMGVSIHLGKATTEIRSNPDGSIAGLQFKDGGTLDCDMVVISAGIRPNSEIGRTAGLTVERAIVVDNHMRSPDDPRVYAVGECAQHRGKVYGLVAPLWEQARVFADHVTGVNRQSQYNGSKLATKLKVMGVELASMGLTEPEHPDDEVVQFTEARRGTYKKLIVRDGRLVGGILMGDISKAAYLMQAFDRDSPLPDERLSLLFDLGAPPQAVTIAEMPDGQQVCNCNGVSKGTIGGCVESGLRDAAAVMEATRAGLGCGSCRSQVAEVVEWFCARLPQPSAELVAAPASAAMPRVATRVEEAAAEDGTLTVSAEMVDGLVTPEDLIRLAEIARAQGARVVRLAGSGGLALAGIPRERLGSLRDALGADAA